MDSGAHWSIDEVAAAVAPHQKKQILAVSASLNTVATTPWMLAAGATAVRMTRRISSSSGSLVTRARIRYADVRTDEPGAWTNFGSSLPGDGIDEAETTPSSGKMFLQLGVGASAAGAEGFLYAQGSVVGAGRIVAAGTFSVSSSINGSTVGVFPIGDPFPVVGLTGLMYALTVKGNTTGNTPPSTAVLSGYYALQYIPVEPDEPNVWEQVGVATFSLSTATGANADYNSGSLTPPAVPAAPNQYPLLGRAGIAVTGANVNADISVVVAAIY